MPGRADVLVVGAGPAGSSTAYQLARRGVQVRVVDRAAFPRSKPCAECLSPQASRILHDMGALAELEAAAVQLRGMIVRAPDGSSARGDYESAHGYTPFRARGLSLRREQLDVALLERARRAGAVVDERVQIADVMRAQDGSVVGVVALDDRGSRRELRATIVIGADGLRSVVARRLRLARAAAWPRRISLVAHYRGVREVGDYGEMHIERDGFVGIADVGNGVTTVAAVFPRARAREMSGGRARFLDCWIASKPHLRERFADATHVDGVTAVGPFASQARRASHPGALLVGDAADFYDPFTGEGIYAGLRGGELAAAAAHGALEHRTNERDAFRSYEDARRREFRSKWIVERLIACGVALPPIANRAVASLRADKSMADLLVGVTGDFIPARRVLRIDYLAHLFALPAFAPWQ